MSNNDSGKSSADPLTNNEYLTFIISGEIFAVSIMRVKEIIEYRELTHVPMVPEFISGAINLRGSVVPVINLAIKFGLASAPVNRRTCVVIIETELDGETTVMGVLVDKVLQVLDIAEQNIEPAPKLGVKIRTDFIEGMGKVDENFVIILSIDKVLSEDEISVLDGMQSDGGEQNLSAQEVI